MIVKLIPHKKYDVAVFTINPVNSNDIICNNLLKFLNKCKLNNIYVTKIKIEISEITIVTILVAEEKLVNFDEYFILE